MEDEHLKHLYDIREAAVAIFHQEDLGKLLEDVERLLTEEDRSHGCT
jgi:hypothetical protein